MKLIKLTTKAGFVYINPLAIQAVDRDNLGSYVRLSNYSQGVLEPVEKVLELLDYNEVEYKVTAVVNPIDNTKAILKKTPTKKPTPATKKKAKKR